MTETPVGTDEGGVVAWLDEHGIRTSVHRFPRDVEASEVTRDYGFPLNNGPFDGMIREAVAEYGFVVTSVEVFYCFADGRLADIGVRKASDGLSGSGAAAADVSRSEASKHADNRQRENVRRLRAERG